MSNKPYVFSGEGTIYTHTTIYDAPEGYEHLVPYTVGIIKLTEGSMVTAMLRDVDRAYITPAGEVLRPSQQTIPQEIIAESKLRLVDPYDDIVDIDSPVEMVTGKIREDGDKGMLIYGYEFRPPIKRS